MSRLEPLRLLLAVESANRGEEIAHLLRHHGIATRTELVPPEADVGALVKSDRWDVLLCETGEDPEPVRALLERIGGASAPIRVVIVDSSGDVLRLTKGLEWGAADVVFADQETRLALVLRREHEFARVRRGWQRAEDALAEAEARNRLLLESSKAAIAYVHEGMHIYANEAYLALYGFADEDDLAGVPLLDIVAPAHVDAVRERMKQFPDGGATEPFEIAGLATDGREFPIVVNLSQVAYEGEPCIQVLVRQPEAKPAPSPASPASPASRREAALEEVGKLIKTGSGAVLYLHLDSVPELREQVGVTRFPAVMAAVRAVCAEAVPDGTPVMPLTDTALVIPLAGQTVAAAAEMAERVRGAVEGRILEVGDRNVQVTCTIGAAPLVAGDDAEALIERAHLACRNAEQRNSVAVHQEETANAENDAELAHISELIGRHLDENSLVVLFQPIISLRGDNDEHYEVFLRLPDDEGDALRPHEFFPVAQDAGLAGRIDRWVVLQSIKTLSAHRASGHDTRLTINLSSASLLDSSFLPWLSVAIKAARLPSDAVIFQITEEDAARHPRDAQAFVEGLHELHCRASLSHFGATTNPFGILRHLPVDYVKLDGDMVLDEEKRAGLAETISSLQAQGKLTIVPMVESATVLASLWQAGANYIQGHYLQEPSRQMDYDFANDA